MWVSSETVGCDGWCRAVRVVGLTWDIEDDGLVVRAALFAENWQRELEDRLTGSHHIQLRLDDPPRDVLAEIYALALDVTEGMRPGTVIVTAHEGELTTEVATLVGALHRRCRD